MPPRTRRALKDKNSKQQISSKKGTRKGQPPTNSCSRKRKNCTNEGDEPSNSSDVGPIQRKKKSKPLVISLDVTFSSSSEQESDVEEIISPFELILSESINCSNDNKSKSSCEKSDSSDSSDCEVYGFSPLKNINKNEKNENDNDDCYDQDCTDLYGSNYEVERLQAFKNLKDTLKTSPKTNGPFIGPSSDDLFPNFAKPESPLNDISASLDISSVYVKPIAKPRRTKKTKEALLSLESFSQRFHQDIKSKSDEHEMSADDIIFVDDAESSEINIKIRWGMSYIKIPIQKDKKFLVLYQQLAEKYNVSVNDVVLSCKDRVLSPELRLKDSGLSVADIIEGGLINNRSKESLVESPTEGKDLISLKVQSSTKNDSTTLTMSKYDKMLILMQNYATAKKLNLHTLKFQFDGETINPNDIALELDLEGGECIDVFHI